MIGIDTNVLVRYIAQDDPKQSPQATRIIESLHDGAPGHVTLVALVETIWVLEDLYSARRDDVVQTVEGLLSAREIRIDRADIVRRALRAFEASKADFADCLIAQLGLASGCEYTATFDLKAAKLEGMKLAS